MQRASSVAVILGLALALLALVGTGCSGGGGDSVCRVGADCASGVCRPDGTCLPVDAADAGPDAAPAPDADPASCQPDHDFVVTRAEVPLAAGLHGTFQVALDAPVSTAGAARPDGSREWSLAGQLPGDHAVVVDTLPMAGAWYAASFPGATYATRLSDESDLLGVFELTADALLLRGVVSPEGGALRTELSYDPPAQVLVFPLSQGGTWKTQTTITGVTSGIASLGSETWEAHVDQRGALDTPLGRFDHVVRVHVKLTRVVGALVTVKQSHAFVAECYGTVATINSQDNQLDTEFSSAAEVRRIAP